MMLRALYRRLLRRGTFVLPALLSLQVALAVTPAWTGSGSYRLLIRVDPVDIGARPGDQLAASYPIGPGSLLGPMPIPGEADLSSLQVHKYDPVTGQAEAFVTFENAISPYDRPCRFDDNSVPTAYPDRVGYASDYANGRPPVTTRQRGGRLFNREMDASSGQVIWLHTQTGNEPSYYAIYWDAKPAGAVGPGPSPWIGDVDVYRLPTGQPLCGLAQLSSSVGDLNGDGLFDIIAGAEKGDVMWFPNRGTPGNPVFRGCRMLSDEVGPIDAGWYASPFLYDWDHDGKLDLLLGTSHNAILWWKNTGTASSPSMLYRGFVQADGARLQVPQSPVPEDTSGSFGVDYYNQPWVGDWNADGLPDILTGGYTTGRIYYYRCTGRDGAGVPILTYVGPVQADGNALDTGWAASPAASDVNGDGLLELLTGSWAFQQPPSATSYLMYYRNMGTPAAANLARAAFPKIGELPPRVIARPAIVDWNADGKKDLLVSDASGDVLPFLNQGTAANPAWNMVAAPLTGSWGFVTVPSFMSVADIDADGGQEFLAGSAVYGTQGSIYTPRFVAEGSATVDGTPIWYPGPGYGDPYNWNIFAEWNGDGIVDVLSGTQQGNVYYHRGLGTQNGRAFAPGIKLTLTNGQDLKVGPPVYSDPGQVPDFTALQGSRIIMACADFDRDGIKDLAVTETYGNIWIFRNTTAGGTATLAPGVVVLSGPRLDGLDVVDWNKDSKPDLITGLSVNTPGAIFINQSTPGTPSFASAIYPLNLPFVFWGPIFTATDWNGDGDEDFLIRSEFYFFWAERSFIERGYRQAVPASGNGWLSTFDTGPDGVVYLNQSNTRSMIGAASGGRLPITNVNAAGSTDFNRAGRPLGRAYGASDTFTGSYRFNWSQLYQGGEQSGWGSVQFAGFVGDSGGAMFRQMAGALLQHKRALGHYYLKLGIMTGAGSRDGYLADTTWLDLGTTGVPSTTYQLVLDYNGPAGHTMTVTFKDAAGNTIRSMSTTLDTLITSANVNQLALTHLGWSDYSGAVGAWTQTNIPYVWQVDSLEFRDNAVATEVRTGACCLPETGTCIEATTASLCAGQPAGTFGGIGSTCASVACQSRCPVPFADADRDGDVDQEDFSAFQLCLTGPDDPALVFDPVHCACFDRENGGAGDQDVDDADFAKFYACFSGARQPALADCEPAP